MRRRLLFATAATSLVLAQQAQAQTKLVTGRVVDARGQGLEGVTVRPTGTKTGTITGRDGVFSLSVPEGVKSLVVSALNYNEVTVAITGTSMNVQLSDADKDLSEVVVTGYKNVNRRAFGGAASIISGESVRNIPIASFDQLLQGQAPGIVARATSGQPGASGSIQIRGRGTLVQGGTEPLYILDGIRIAATDFALINPNDIETFNVIKDAAAAGLYGSEGANGVIVITTKKGKPGKTRFDLDGFMGWSTLPKFRDFSLMNTEQKITYEQRRNALLPAAARTNLAFYTPAELDSLRRINTNWEDELSQVGKTYNISGSASGGSEKLRFFSSVNYFKQEGTIRTTFFDRITGRLNVNQEAGNFSFGANVTGTYSRFTNTSEQNTTIAAPLNGLQWANPYEQTMVRGRYTPAGNFTTAGLTPNDITRPRVTGTGQPIPTTDLFWNNFLANQIRVLASGNAEYRFPFLDGLSARVVYGIDYRQFEDVRFVDRKTYTGGSNPRPTSGAFSNFRTNSFARDFTYRQRITNNFSLGYARKFGEHTFDANVYYETVDLSGSNAGNTTFSLITPLQNEAGATVNADLIPRIRGGRFQQIIKSYFGMINYGFKNKYFLNATFRHDGSSVFGENNRFAQFGGAALSWQVSDEAFFETIKPAINSLKYKISYGTVGNQANLGSYASQGTVVANRLYNAIAGSAVSVLPNPDLQWEVRKKFNTGVEMSFLKSKLNVNVDVYNELSEDLLTAKEISLTNGFTSINDNVASVRNTGLELSVNYRIVNTKDLNVSVNGNFTYNKNEVVALADGRDTLVQLVGGIPMARIVGQPMNQLFLVNYVGVNPATGAAIYRQVDGQTTETFSPNLRQAAGVTDPKFFGGFGFNVDYKGLSLMTQFSYMLGMKIYNNERNNLENPDYFYDNMNADLLTQEWQKPGDNVRIPSPDNPFFAETTRFLEDNSFVRLRNITLAYALPKSLMSKAKLSGVSIYVSGTNLWTSTKYRGRDPESAAQVATQGAQYPALKTVQAGIRVAL